MICGVCICVVVVCEFMKKERTITDSTFEWWIDTYTTNFDNLSSDDGETVPDFGRTWTKPTLTLKGPVTPLLGSNNFFRQ